MYRLLVFTLCVLGTGTVLAQRDASAEIITVEAVDGKALVGEYYPTEENAPSVLLLHMLGSLRRAWLPLIPSLNDAGYNVLTIDLRGHGETGGARDWLLAERDVFTWIDWLQDQSTDPSRPVVLIGASIGANLALIGCAADERCHTVIALSPGVDYLGVMPESAIEGLSDRPVLLVASQDDREAADAVRTFTQIAQGELGVQLYRGRRHGTDLLNADPAPVITLINEWLAETVPTAR